MRWWWPSSWLWQWWTLNKYSQQRSCKNEPAYGEKSKIMVASSELCIDHFKSKTDKSTYWVIIFLRVSSQKRLAPSVLTYAGPWTGLRSPSPAPITHFALVPQDPTEYCHQWSPTLDLQVTFMVRPAQKQCSLTMITQNGWIAFLSKQKE